MILLCKGTYAPVAPPFTGQGDNAPVMHLRSGVPDSDSLTSREWNLSVKINGNRGAQQEICFNKTFKEIVPFQQEFPI